MRLQVISDEYGINTGVFVPINDWNELTDKFIELKSLVNIQPKPKQKLSELYGTISKETGDEMQKYVIQSRNEWEDRLNKID